jgi:zinc transporter ZupT
MTLPLLILLFLVLPLAAGAWVRFKTANTAMIKLLLAFSGAFLLGVTVLHMLPELYGSGDPRLGVWILLGFMLQVVLEFFSRGIEHGHVHIHGVHHAQALPTTTLASLFVHSFVEGMPFADPRVGGDAAFVAGVLMHKLPMAIALASILHQAGSGRTRSWVTLAAFAASAPLGILFASTFGDRFGEGFLVAALAVAIGMLLHISTTIIFESTPDHRFNARRFLTVLGGVVLAYLVSH